MNRTNKTQDKYYAMHVYNPGRFDPSYNRAKRFLDHPIMHVAHTHVNTPLASWTYDGSCYTLSPYGDSNLQGYMNSLTRCDKSVIHTILVQVLGLCKGLAAIHGVSEREAEDAAVIEPPDGTQLDGTQQQALPATELRLWSCYYMNIKPENILVFKGTLKLSCLCCIKIEHWKYGDSPYQKQEPFTQKWNEPCQAPEALDRCYSLPSDIWSMGAVLLEFIVWLVLGLDGLAAFRKGRHGRVSSRSDPDERFFVLGAEDKPRRREAVQDMLDRLDQQCRGPLETLLNEVKKMLSPAKEDRPSAEEVARALSSLEEATEDDFDGYGWAMTLHRSSS